MLVLASSFYMPHLVFDALRVVQAGIASNWFGLACPAHCKGTDLGGFVHAGPAFKAAAGPLSSHAPSFPGCQAPALPVQEHKDRPDGTGLSGLPGEDRGSLAPTMYAQSQVSLVGQQPHARRAAVGLGLGAQEAMQTASLANCPKPRPAAARCKGGSEIYSL